MKSINQSYKFEIDKIVKKNNYIYIIKWILFWILLLVLYIYFFVFDYLVDELK